MWTIVKKEWLQFFTGWMGYISITVYLLVSGVMLFYLPEENLLDAGYASLDPFFDLSPILLLILIPAVTMRSFSEEYKTGTFDLLTALPIKRSTLVFGKFVSVFLIVLVALISSFVYICTLFYFSLGGLDTGAIIGSYTALVLLSLLYSSIGIFISSHFENSLASFMLTAFSCFIGYYVFSFFPDLYIGQFNIGYYIALIGVKYHFENISKGYLAFNDLVYFLSFSTFFLYQTIAHLRTHTN